MTLVTLSEVTLFLNTAGESWTIGPHCSSSGPCFVPVFNFLNYTVSVCIRLPQHSCGSWKTTFDKQLSSSTTWVLSSRSGCQAWVVPTEPFHHPCFCFGSKICRVYLVGLALTCVPGWPPGCWDGRCGPQPVCPHIPLYHSLYISEATNQAGKIEILDFGFWQKILYERKWACGIEIAYLQAFNQLQFILCP